MFWYKTRLEASTTQAEQVHCEVSKTGIRALDEVLADTPFIEFFGDWSPVSLLAHRFMAQNSGDVVLTQEFGGINTYLVERISKNIGEKPELRIVRAFSLETTIEALQLALESKSQLATVIDPYHYAPRDWREYSALTKITASLRALSLTKSVVVFNRSSKFGSKAPEGGAFHSSSVPVLIRVSASNRSLYATIVKHPALPQKRVSFTYTELYGLNKNWGEQRFLSEWL
jgi:hypothetical protein